MEVQNSPKLLQISRSVLLVLSSKVFQVCVCGFGNYILVYHAGFSEFFKHLVLPTVLHSKNKMQDQIANSSWSAWKHNQSGVNTIRAVWHRGCDVKAKIDASRF